MAVDIIDFYNYAYYLLVYTFAIANEFLVFVVMVFVHFDVTDCNRCVHSSDYCELPN